MADSGGDKRGGGGGWDQTNAPQGMRKMVVVGEKIQMNFYLSSLRGEVGLLYWNLK